MQRFLISTGEALVNLQSIVSSSNVQLICSQCSMLCDSFLGYSHFQWPSGWSDKGARLFHIRCIGNVSRALRLCLGTVF